MTKKIQIKKDPIITLIAVYSIISSFAPGNIAGFILGICAAIGLLQMKKWGFYLYISRAIFFLILYFRYLGSSIITTPFNTTYIIVLCILTAVSIYYLVFKKTSFK
ncbi:MAG TPA: hypothetical protein VG917_03525 [Patescibacteria group bacterium]|nr:hypothetical protein [Patescibacteria group bacterium]